MKGSGRVSRSLCETVSRPGRCAGSPLTAGMSFWRRTRIVVINEARPKPAATQNARLKPDVRSAAVGAASPGRFEVRVVATVVRRARPSAPPICWLVLMSPDARPASGPSTPGERGDRDRHEREAHADADDQEAGQQVDRVGAVDRHLGEVDEPDREQGHSDHQHGLDAQLGDETLRDRGGDDDRQRDGEVAEAGLHRREAQHLLHVERQQEEHPEDHRPQAEADDVRARERAPLEDREGDERRVRAASRSRGRPPSARPTRRRRRSSAPRPSRPGSPA